ncbi:MAG: hypothetical protein H0T95_10215 [Chthoniobacterales bacterium]|nr:hypothetical protein [Chthoniobacterales bacterium]
MSWPPDFDELGEVTEANARLILEEAKAFLSATVGDAEQLTRNSLYVLGAILALLSALAGLIARGINLHVSLTQQDWRQLTVYGVLFGFVALTGFRLLQGAFQSRDIEHVGNAPENLVRKEYVSLPHGTLLLLEACSYRERIQRNVARNIDTGVAINTAIKWLCATPLIFAACSLAITFT